MKYVYVICFGISSETFLVIVGMDRRCAFGDYGRMDHLTVLLWYYDYWYSWWDTSWLIIEIVITCTSNVTRVWFTQLCGYHIGYLIIDIVQSSILCIIGGPSAPWKEMILKEIISSWLWLIFEYDAFLA